jgi:hypothetical protein
MLLLQQYSNLFSPWFFFFFFLSWVCPMIKKVDKISKWSCFFFSCYDYYYWMVKKKLYFFSIKFPNDNFPCIHLYMGPTRWKLPWAGVCLSWSWSKISYVDTYKEDRQLRLKRCRILWSSIHDWMSLGFGYGDVSHEIHVVCCCLERRLGAFDLGTSLNWFYFVCWNSFLSISLCLTWSAENSRNSKIIFKIISSTCRLIHDYCIIFHFYFVNILCDDQH